MIYFKGLFFFKFLFPTGSLQELNCEYTKFEYVINLRICGSSFIRRTGFFSFTGASKQVMVSFRFLLLKEFFLEYIRKKNLKLICC